MQIFCYCNLIIDFVYLHNFADWSLLPFFKYCASKDQNILKHNANLKCITLYSITKKILKLLHWYSAIAFQFHVIIMKLQRKCIFLWISEKLNRNFYLYKVWFFSIYSRLIYLLALSSCSSSSKRTIWLALTISSTEPARVKIQTFVLLLKMVSTARQLSYITIA